jgi:hypothetical protein
MSRWRGKALELLPEFKATIDTAETPYQLWFELLAALQEAYQAPRNEALMRQIYLYADWCWRQRPQKEVDLCNCVAVSFYEHLVDHAATRSDLPRWISEQKFEDLASLFRMRLESDDFDALKLHHARSWKMYQPDVASPKGRPGKVR